MNTTERTTSQDIRYRLRADNSPIGMLADASLYAGMTPEKPATDQATSQSATARTWYLPFGRDGLVACR